jgi:hypothetical protein
MNVNSFPPKTLVARHNQLLRTGTNGQPLERSQVPPPVFWTQNPCFVGVTGRIALQNRHNKGVACKILQDKELRAVKQGPGKRESSNTVFVVLASIVRARREIICKAAAVRQTALARQGVDSGQGSEKGGLRFVVSQVPKSEGPGHSQCGLKCTPEPATRPNGT